MDLKTHSKPQEAFEYFFKEECIQYPIENEIEIVEFARRGITKASLSRIGEYGNFSMKELAALLHVSESTLYRYSDDKRLSGDISERGLLLAMALARGVEVFGSSEAMKEWIHSTVIALGGRTPFSLMDTSSGLQLVLDLLGRIQHGVYS